MEEITLRFEDVQVTAHPNGRRPLLVISHGGQLVDRLKVDVDDLGEREKAALMLEARLPGRRWLTILRDVAQALAEARSSGFVSINNMPVETKRNREVRAADLQAQAKEEGRALRYLPLLGREGYIVKGFTHLISGYAKAGKTQLLAQVVGEWQEESILWFTEEPQAVWEARLARLPDVYHHVTLYFALGCPRQELLERIAQGQETVVIVDTTKLLGITDPDHAGEVTTVLAPVIASCREAGKTLILVHHERKGGGQHGEGIAGSHAFLAMADLALEVLRDDKSPKRRIIRGYGRIVTVPDLCYEMAEDGTLVPLGDPEELALEQVKERALSLLTEDWQSLRDIMSGMGDPKPSEDQVRRALNDLVEEGKAERDPPLGTKGNKAHRWRLAASPFRFDGHTFNRNETEPVAQEEGLPEEEWGSSVRQEPPFRFDGQSINRNETEPIGHGGPTPPTDPLAQALAVFEPEGDAPPTQDPPPPLPPNIRPVCPRCGSVGELVRTKCYCPACFLIFSPPHIPKWALEVFWEEAAQGEFPNTEFPNRAGVSEHDFPNKGRVSERPGGVSEHLPGVSEHYEGVSEQAPEVSEHLDGLSEQPRGVSEHGLSEHPRGLSEHHAGLSEHRVSEQAPGVSEHYEGVSEQPARKVSEQAGGVSEQPARLSEHLEGVSERHKGVSEHRCPGCGRGVALASTGRPRRWCSDACRMRHRRSRGGPTNGERC
jgi:hypothetical protein